MVFVITLFNVLIKSGSLLGEGNDFPVVSLKNIMQLAILKRNKESQRPSVLTSWILSSKLVISFCLKTNKLSLVLKTVNPPTNNRVEPKIFKTFTNCSYPQNDQNISFFWHYLKQLYLNLQSLKFIIILVHWQRVRGVRESFGKAKLNQFLKVSLNLQIFLCFGLLQNWN